MNWQDVAKTIHDDAPMLSGVLAATGVGAPLAAAVSAAGALAGALGVPATPDDVAQALATSPDAAVKLKQIESDKTLGLQQLAVQLAANQLQADTSRMAAEFADRDSARKREEVIKDRTPAVMAYLVTLGFFGVLAYLLAYGKPAAGGDALLVMLGALGTAWTAIVQYFYGSSAGSDRKTDLLAQAPAIGK